MNPPGLSSYVQGSVLSNAGIAPSVPPLVLDSLNNAAIGLFLHSVIRIIELVLGIFFVFTATALYPDEEGKLRSKFEDIWVRADDFENRAVSRHTTFVTQLAQLQARMLDKVFGTNLLSGKALSVSFCLSIASVSLAALFVSHHHKEPLSKDLVYLAAGLLLAAILNSVLSEDNKIRNSVVGILGAFGVFVCARANNLGFLSSGNVRTLMVALMSIGAVMRRAV
jgi:hypothetical protein